MTLQRFDSHGLKFSLICVDLMSTERALCVCVFCQSAVQQHTPYAQYKYLLISNQLSLTFILKRSAIFTCTYAVFNLQPSQNSSRNFQRFSWSLPVAAWQSFTEMDEQNTVNHSKSAKRFVAFIEY